MSGISCGLLQHACTARANKCCHMAEGRAWKEVGGIQTEGWNAASRAGGSGDLEERMGEEKGLGGEGFTKVCVDGLSGGLGGLLIHRCSHYDVCGRMLQKLAGTGLSLRAMEKNLGLLEIKEFMHHLKCLVN